MNEPSTSGSETARPPTPRQQPPSSATKAPVLRIRKDNTHQFLSVPATTAGISVFTGDFELGHAPNVSRFWRRDHSWELRLCIGASIADGDDEKTARLSHIKGMYIVMICRLEALGLNEAVDGTKGSWVYGDAFVFRVGEEVDGDGRAVFEQVPAEMISLGIARRLLAEVAGGWKGGLIPKGWINGLGAK